MTPIKRILKRAALAVLIAGAASLPSFAEDAAKFDTGMIPAPHILFPKEAASGAVVLLSDAGGWTEREDAVARKLSGEKALVIGIDLKAYLAALGRDDGDCVYAVSDIESLSQQVQRAAGSGAYRPPIVAGVGAGGAMALAIAAQSPAATIGRTLAVDPEEGIALTKQLCTPAEKTRKGDRMVYGLTDGALPDPVTVVSSPSASAAGREHVAALAAKHPDVEVQESDEDVYAALSSTLAGYIQQENEGDNPFGLPLTVLDAKPARDTMAVIYSGDGGWRDIDKEVGNALQQQGVPVVGVDSLRYFWSERQPQATADDLARVITYYGRRWNVRNVLLIGYSFGADILPRTYNLLPSATRARIRQVTLMALSHRADYKISVLGWLGADGEGNAGDPVDDIKAIEPVLVQCIYGTDEEDDACPDLKSSGIDVVPIKGGHHFDGDYAALTRRVLDALDRRLAMGR
ncbi:virulence factor family protein [Sinorhizobium meliloti WSM1022]|jgi:type IV secretory pathway VirJ component|uniref:virulence factor n=1 Tax=Rhizobium meliloti TaxID=382 RepID=UPI000417B56A|nr:virulence factor family protein [Sinorhizobium meliloti]ASQ04506.1 virulence factor family protein [Sinorhizobium meliloti]MCO6423679.1 virulence factor family protein [Sinorhizobium meliloti]MDW9411621.1 virulence factor family protein [Sinorhizobium meliloti]MDW9444414.1 virulence factor family protein [Sinorhizobium meliloti]MDW9457158.1 virulence factor family protein [Sinorhizobium meliloti]